MRRRRRPNFVRFILTGAVIGFALGGYLGWSGVFEKPTVLTQKGTYAAGTVVGYLGLLGAVLCAVLAAVIAVLLDRRAD